MYMVEENTLKHGTSTRNSSCICHKMYIISFHYFSFEIRKKNAGPKKGVFRCPSGRVLVSLDECSTGAGQTFK